MDGGLVLPNRVKFRHFEPPQAMFAGVLLISNSYFLNPIFVYLLVPHTHPSRY